MAEILSADRAYGEVMRVAAEVAAFSMDLTGARAGLKLDADQCELAGVALGVSVARLLRVAAHIRPELTPAAAEHELSRLLHNAPLSNLSN